MSIFPKINKKKYTRHALNFEEKKNLRRLVLVNNILVNIFSTNSLLYYSTLKNRVSVAYCEINFPKLKLLIIKIKYLISYLTEDKLINLAILELKDK